MKGKELSMNCVNFKVRTKKYSKFTYCSLRKKQISYQECVGCKYKEFKEYKPLKRTPIKKTTIKQSKRAKATDIPQKVKEKVFARDEGKCVVCGNSYNVMPNAHYISRATGGLGIEENIVTLCTNLTENQCHRVYDFGNEEEKETIREKIREHLKSKYMNWNEENLIFKKYN